MFQEAILHFWSTFRNINNGHFNRQANAKLWLDILNFPGQMQTFWRPWLQLSTDGACGSVDDWYLVLPAVMYTQQCTADSHTDYSILHYCSLRIENFSTKRNKFNASVITTKTENTIKYTYTHRNWRPWKDASALNIGGLRFCLHPSMDSEKSLWMHRSLHISIPEICLF